MFYYKKWLTQTSLVFLLLFINEGYAQSNEPKIKQGGIVVEEKNGHGFVVAPKQFNAMDWNNAVYACNELELNGYNDWHLATIDELYIINANKSKIGDFADKTFWSSTEFGFEYSFVWSFNCQTSNAISGVITSKFLSNQVIAVRTF